MRTVDLIQKKRDGGAHSREEIRFLVDSFTSGETPDYQMSAWMMALLLRGASEAETAALTEAMLESGRKLDVRSVPGMKVDKHSTGGVGDKTSLVVAPIAAAGGLIVPMISGRGLGHTGGTLDKLESIPGFSVRLTASEMERVLQTAGCCITGQTEEIAPADRKMYALRDVTGTVESPALICASIMSKKLAAGLDALVLDVKTGSGAFMRQQKDAENLARLMVDTGERMGTKMAALITDMDQPLGRAVGNALEVTECLEILAGGPERMSEDLRELSLELAAWMFILGGKAPDVGAGRRLAEQIISSGAAMERFEMMARAQGATDWRHLPQAKHSAEFAADSSGYLARVDCARVGLCCLASGGGRSRKEDVIDPAVGLTLRKKVGDAVEKGDSIATVHYNDRDKLPECLGLLGSAYRIEPEPPRAQLALVRQIIHRAEKQP